MTLYCFSGITMLLLAMTSKHIVRTKLINENARPTTRVVAGCTMRLSTTAEVTRISSWELRKVRLYFVLHLYQSPFRQWQPCPISASLVSPPSGSSSLRFAVAHAPSMAFSPSSFCDTASPPKLHPLLRTLSFTFLRITWERTALFSTASPLSSHIPSCGNISEAASTIQL